MLKSDTAVQSTFAEFKMNGLPEENGSGSFNDPAFASNKKAEVHRWVPWIAGFSREFVQSALDRHLRKKGVVLDPFAGVGTTLIESLLAGHSAVGFEINPYAALAAQVKATAYRVDPDAFGQTIAGFEAFYERAVRKDVAPISRPPAGFKTRAEFYSPRVLRQVLIVNDFIAGLKRETVRDLFRVAFASTMITYSNYSYEPSLGRRVAAGRKDIEDYPVGQTIVRKLDEMKHDVIWMRDRLKDMKPKAQVFNASFFTCRSKLSAGSVDLVVTSPPYVNNYHYNRNTRPHLYWLGYAATPDDMKLLEQNNFGKYWQTVRGEERVDLDFPLADNEIVERLELLRTKSPEKGVYGGNGWANYAASYFNDCYRFAKAVKFVLKRRGTALVVIGNSILQGVMIPTDQYFAKIAQAVGLRVIDIHIPRAIRVGNSIIQSDVRVAKAKDSHQLYEAVVELRRR